MSTAKLHLFGSVDGGANGKSAYEIACAHGFEGTEEEWLASLKGADGKSGKDGVSVSSVEKIATNDKVDTYQITLTNGNTFNFDITNGRDGRDGQDGADGKDYSLTNEDVDYIAKLAEQRISTSHLQSKTDNGLETESKEIVGAINELSNNITGVTWVLYDDLAGANPVEYEFNFTSNGREFSGMKGELHREAVGGDPYNVMEWYELFYRLADSGEYIRVYDGFINGWDNSPYQTINTVATEVYLPKYAMTLSLDEALRGLSTKKITTIGEGLNTKAKSVVGAINELYSSTLMLVGYVDGSGKIWEDEAHQSPVLISFCGDYSVQAEMSFVKIVIDLHTKELIFGAIDYVISEQLKGTELGQWIDLIMKSGVKASQDINTVVASTELYKLVYNFLGDCKTLLDRLDEWVQETEFYKAIDDFLSAQTGKLKDALTNYVNETEIDGLEVEETEPQSRAVSLRNTKTIVGSINALNHKVNNIKPPEQVSTADKLSTARKITFTGDVSGAMYFDGSTDKSVEITVLKGSANPNGKVTDLTGTTWHIRSGWKATAGYGSYSLKYKATVGEDVYNSELTLQIGSTFVKTYAVGDVVLPTDQEDSIVFAISAGQYIPIDSTQEFTLEITGGSGATNTDLIDWLYEYGELDTLYQTKEDKNLETESKEIVGAINELNSKIPKESIVGTWRLNEAIAPSPKDFGVHFTNNGEEYYVMEFGQDGALYYSVEMTDYSMEVYDNNGWLDDLYRTIEILEEPTDAEFITWLKANGTKQLVDLSNLATVDKITRFNINCEANTNVNYDDANGTTWDTWVEIETENGEGAYSEFTGRVPIVAGKNVTFELDDENQVVKINATGGGSSPNDALIGTWTVINEPEIPTKELPLKFTSNGVNYDKIGFAITGPDFWGIRNLRYQTQNNEYDQQVYVNNPSGGYGITHGWADEAYRTITVTEAPYDVDTIAWLGNNTDAPKITPSSSGNGLEMPQIRFTSATGCSTETPTLFVDADNPLKLTVEIVGGGALQVGDALQVCTRRRFNGSRANGFKRKYKLHRFAEYIVTEDDLDKRFLSVDIYVMGDTRPQYHALFHDGQGGSGSPLSPLYLRIRRPKGDMQNNDSGQTVDAEFSNIVTIWKTYMRGDQTIKIL